MIKSRIKAERDDAKLSILWPNLPLVLLVGCRRGVRVERLKSYEHSL